MIVDYKDTGNFSESIDQLSQAPGLAWMGELRARDDVQWNAVQEAHQSWDYRTQGISPTGAAIIALAVAIATGPGSLGFMEHGVGATLDGAEVGGTFAAVANAGFSSLVTQATTAIVGNGGDIGTSLKQLGSVDTLKGLATSMVTAGLLASVPTDGLTTPTTGLEGSALKMTDFANKLKVGIAQASISATVDSVINGAPLTDNLKNGLVNAVVSVAGAEVANIIGQQAALAGTDPDNSAAAVKGGAVGIARRFGLRYGICDGRKLSKWCDGSGRGRISGRGN